MSTNNDKPETFDEFKIHKLNEKEDPTADETVLDEELPGDLKVDNLIENGNQIFVIGIMNIRPRWKDMLDHKLIKDSLQVFLERLKIFNSNKSKSKRRQGSNFLAEVKGHPLLHADCSMVFSCRPPKNCQIEFALLKLQTIYNRHPLTMVGQFQTCWLPSYQARFQRTFLPALRFTYIDYIRREQLLLKRAIDEGIGIGGLNYASKSSKFIILI